MWFNQYPYINVNDLNLDYLLRSVKQLRYELENFVNINTIKYANPIQWNITKQYEANTVVIDANDGTAYLSVKPVPSGVAITNTDYWTSIFTLNLLSANQNITLRDDSSNVLATFSSVAGDWLIWNNTLYKVTQAINVNEAYVVGYNLTRFSVELFIKEYLNDVLTIIGDLDDLNTTDKTSVVNAINELLVDIDDVMPSNYLDPRKYGAVLDGVTDDSAAITAALADGSIVFPSGCDVKINNIYVPDFRTLDFNGSFVYTDNYAIRCEATNDHGYVRGITIKDAHFKTPDVANATAHSYGGVYLDGVIKARIINCEVANCYDGTDFAYIRNSFNVSIENCYCGTGNAANSSDSSFVTYYCGDAIISGSDNITNCNITNALAQRIAHGIYIDAQGGLFDSCKFDNVGFSYVDKCIETIGASTRIRNTNVSTLRCEFSGSGIINTGYMSVNDCYFTRMSTACIVNSGTMVVSGNVSANNPNDYNIVPLYDNSGKLNTVDTYPEFLTRVSLNNTGIFNKPVIIGATATNFIDNSYMSNIFTIATGTSASAEGTVTIAYPSGFDRDNTIVVSCRIYRTNNTWVETTCTISSAGLLVYTPNDSTLFNRGIEVIITPKS